MAANRARVTREQPSRRWPAEWEPHAATWIAWPHHREDWPSKFEAIPWVYAEIVRVLHRSEPVHILCNSEETREQALRCLRAHDVDLSRCYLHLVPTDRAWLRDSGPTGVHGPGGFEWVCWGFNAWAKYPNYERDERVSEAIVTLSGYPAITATRSDASTHRAPGLPSSGAGASIPRVPAGGGDSRPRVPDVRAGGGAPTAPHRLVLEGGGIETNGAGTLLVTEEWLLSDVQVRNPGMTRADYESAFREYLGIERTIWLAAGVAGDDTHGHIDDVARFTDPNTIVLTYEEDLADENHERMADNLERLNAASRTVPGGLRIVTLPFPRPVIMDGERLPASYANFYIANGVVIAPTFNDANDRVALGSLAELFPGREVIGIHAVDLVWGLGTLHCLTQQQPANRRR